MTSTTISAPAKLWAAVATVAILMLGITVAMAYRGALGAPGPAAEPVATADEVTVEVTLGEFTISPADIVVPADTPVVFAITNNGTVPHDFVIEGLAASELIAGGESATLRVDGVPEGEHRVLCEEAGHEAAGMVGTLTATGDGAAADTAVHGEPGGHAMTAEEMRDAMEDLRGFPAETEGRGNQPLEPTMDGDVKVFELTVNEIDWEVEPGVTRPAMAYNEQIPGPRIDVDLGDTVRLVVTNEMSMPTALHPHGLMVPSEMDGVPGITQDSIMPGETFEYEWTVENAGSHMYHSHFDAAEQVPMGLLGAFIVHGPDEPQVDHDIVMILNDGPLGYTLNGKGFPATEPLVMEKGETARIRYFNEGLQIHPMHTHGMAQQIIARDGYMLDAPWYEDNVLVSPGDRVDVLVEPEHPGVWAWHCHILTHAEAPEGMFGMVTAVVVEG